MQRSRGSDCPAYGSEERKARSADLAELQRSVLSHANQRARPPPPQASRRLKMPGVGAGRCFSEPTPPLRPLTGAVPSLHLDLGLSTSSRAQFLHPYSSSPDRPLIPVWAVRTLPGALHALRHKLPSSKAEPRRDALWPSGLPELVPTLGSDYLR